MADGIPNWWITAVTPWTEFTPNRGPVDGSQVHFLTDTGLSGAIFVPANEASNLDKAREQIIARISSLNDIHNLTG